MGEDSICHIATMAIHMIADLFWKIVPNVNNVGSILKVAAALLVIGLIKWYSMGASNTSERQMHSKVVMITGGTSGIGAATALALAQRGAQIILLVHQSPKDIFLVDYIEDLREKSGNEMIYAEQVDLSSLYSIRQFATKWIDNAPPRRLDMIILCVAKKLWEGSEKLIERVEREEAVRRALERKEQDKANKGQKTKENVTDASEASGSGVEAKKAKSRRQKKAAK